jgi:hypothetical protein
MEQKPAYKRPPREPDLEAEITFFPTSEGGKTKPVTSGYRPSHDFGLAQELNDAQHEYPDHEWIQPVWRSEPSSGYWPPTGSPAA